MIEEDLDIVNQETEEISFENRNLIECIDLDETEELSFEHRRLNYRASLEIERRKAIIPTDEEVARGLESTVNLIFPTFSNVPMSDLRIIGKGGYSHILKGKELRTGKPVALKIARYTLNPTATLEDFERMERMFLEEAAVHKAVSEFHLNLDEDRIVKFLGSGVFEKAYDTGLENGHRLRHINYIATEFMEGKSAEWVLRPDRGVSLPHQFYVLVRLARAIDIAHKAGYAHGDIKEGNAVVCKNGLKVKLADWGNAISLEKNRGSVNVLRTSPRYTSPERFKNMALPSVSDDIWAYGVVVYQTLEGSHPFSVNAKNPFQIIKDSTNNEMIPFKNKEGIDSGLANVARNCLVKDPKLRYQSMEDVMYGLADCNLPWLRH